MKLTDEQLTFLAGFADKGIAEQNDLEQRGKDIEAHMEAKAARDAFVASLVAQKEQEIAVALQDFDSKQTVEVVSTTPVTIDIN